MQDSRAFDELLKRDSRYAPDAYHFVMDALAYTVKKIGQRRHVTGPELLYGIRDFALDSWGLMARHVLESWGITRTDDVGEIVFNMVDAGLMSKTDSDRKDDFKDVFRFLDAFDKSYSLDLDEHGHVRRKVPFVPHDHVTWIPLLGDMGFN